MERLELIERYVEGQMQGTELATFTKELENDATLRQEVTEYKELVGGVRLHGQQNFMNLVASWEKEILAKEKSESTAKTTSDADATFTKVTKTQETKKISLQSQWLKYVTAAACVVLLAVFGYNFFGKVETISGEAAFASEYEPYNAQGTREDDFSKMTELQQLIALYEMKKYPEAMEKYHALQKTAPDSIKTQLGFYHGLTQLATNHLTEAETELARIAQSGDDNFVDPAEWYLAMTLLKENKTEAARNALKNISNTDGHAYRVKAKNILKRLGS